MKFLFSDFDFIFLDLDNTLYDEYIYLESSIRIFLKTIGYEVDNTNNWEHKFRNYYSMFGNNKIYDDFIQDQFEINKCYLSTFINTLREENNTAINLFPGVINFLEQYKSKIILVTDGNIAQQKKKVKILNLEEYICKDKIFYSDSFNGKSSQLFNLFIIKELEIKRFSRGIVIGDNPESDGLLAKNLNFKFCQINENSSLFRQYL